MGYYNGDFYQGDPGFGSFLGKAFGYAKGFLPGGPALGTVGKVVGIVKGRVGGKIMNAGRVLAKHPVMTAAGAAGAIGVAGMGRGSRAAAGMGGGAGGGFGRKHRRMRVTNVKALRRAIRRASGFARIARRVLRFTSPKPPRGRVFFKSRGRKKRV